MTTVPMTPFLRLALRLDAAVSGACGLLMAGLPRPVAALTGLPAPLLLGAGLFLLAYGGLLAWLGARAALPRPMLWLLVAGNLAWAAECAALPLLGWVAPNGLGIAFLAVQAVAVAAFAELYLIALRRAALRSAA